LASREIPVWSAWPDRSSIVGTVGPCSTGGGRGTTSRPPSSPTPGPGRGPPGGLMSVVHRCVNHGPWCRWVPAMSTHLPTGWVRVYMGVSASARLWVCKCVRVWVVGAWLGGWVGVYAGLWVCERVSGWVGEVLGVCARACVCVCVLTGHTGPPPLPLPPPLLRTGGPTTPTTASAPLSTPRGRPSSPSAQRVRPTLPHPSGSLSFL